MSTQNQSVAILRPRQLRLFTGLSDSTIRRLERQGLFPRRRRIGLRAVGWLSAEIDSWLSQRPEKSAVE